MFSNIKNGWADFNFKGFKGVCSYIQDPVKDICKALTGTDESKIITVEMDEEGSEWFLSIVAEKERRAAKAPTRYLVAYCEYLG